jgi:hypothetical protein
LCQTSVKQLAKLGPCEPESGRELAASVRVHRGYVRHFYLLAFYGEAKPLLDARALGPHERQILLHCALGVALLLKWLHKGLARRAADGAKHVSVAVA